MPDTARPATPADAASIARIFNEGIADRTAADIEPWFDGVHPVIVIERDSEIAAFASTSTYRPRTCYAGVAEFSVYTSRAARRTGAGRAAMQFLMREAARAGFWKLVSRVFPENTASLALLYSLAFRAVGTYRKHGQLDGQWRDVVIVEKLLPESD
jgi:L-amino acid N-acyltransferase YncA